MYQITKNFSFEAAHQLIGLPEGHQCGRLHGHSYMVQICLESERLDRFGFVVDYGNLKPLKALIDEHFDHQLLNDLMNPFPSTAEMLATVLFAWCHAQWPETKSVSVSETEKTWAMFAPTTARDFSYARDLFASCNLGVTLFGTDLRDTSYEGFALALKGGAK